MKTLMIVVGVIIALVSGFVALAAWDMNRGEGIDARMYTGRTVGVVLMIAGIVLVVVGILQ